MSFWSKLLFRQPRHEALSHDIETLHLSNYYEGITELDLTAFPLVEDFTIKFKKAGSFGIHLFFYSERFGRLASFPWWDHVERDLPRYTFQNIPSGDLDDPFNDLEQGWQILICEDEYFVYVLQGDDPGCTEFYQWFRVPRERYYEEWMRVIREFNPAA